MHNNHTRSSFSFFLILMLDGSTNVIGLLSFYFHNSLYFLTKPQLTFLSVWCVGCIQTKTRRIHSEFITCSSIKLSHANSLAFKFIYYVCSIRKQANISLKSHILLTILRSAFPSNFKLLLATLIHKQMVNYCKRKTNHIRRLNR